VLDKGGADALVFVSRSGHETEIALLVDSLVLQSEPPELRPGFRRPGIRFHRVAHDFCALVQWKGIVWQNVADSALSTWWIDVRRNAVAVGVRNASEIQRVRRLLVSKGIPDDALYVTVSELHVMPSPPS